MVITERTAFVMFVAVLLIGLPLLMFIAPMLVS